ncbi:MAG: urease accessory protein UreE [Pseudomonadota bacterium]
MDTFDCLLPGAAAAGRSLTLPFERRARSRQRVVLDDGGEALLALPRGTVLRDGDVLGSTAGDQVRPVVVRAAVETVSVAASADPGLLLRAAYHLGNRHVPVQIGPGWLRYGQDRVLDDLCRGLGLEVAVLELPFEPEAGAYAGGGHGHAHGHR